MMTLIQVNLIPITAALLIGILTGRWMFRRRAASSPRPGTDTR